MYDEFSYSNDDLIAVYGQTYGYDGATGNWGSFTEPLFYVDIQNAQAHIHDDDSDGGGSDGSGLRTRRATCRNSSYCSR